MFQLDTVGPHWNIDTSDLLVSLKQFYCIVSEFQMMGLSTASHQKMLKSQRSTLQHSTAYSVAYFYVQLHVFNLNKTPLGTLKNYIIILINASSKPWCFIPPAFLQGLTGFSQGSGTRTWRSAGRSS